MAKPESKKEELFRKQAWYSIHPTLIETGIGIGGFKKPTDAILSVDVGDLANLDCEGPNGGITVRVIKYAGEKPWWKGHLFVEGEGPCWIVESLTRPFEVGYSDGTVQFMVKMPAPDHMLEKLG